MICARKIKIFKCQITALEFPPIIQYFSALCSKKSYQAVKEGQTDAGGCKGAPDLVIEILSPATAAKDMKDKRDLYEKHGIRECWMDSQLVKNDNTILLKFRSGPDRNMA
ncbi:MAG: Uma2 family endonuclease [Proteobacteria bacterium]|nr:Uma2 family endonuclease [Pseudomonadota bacterium]